MIIAFDYGEKRIGVAISDEKNKFANAIKYIPNKSEVDKLFSKDFPKDTSMNIINQERRKAKKEAKIELHKVFNKIHYLVNYYYPEKIIVGLPKVIDKNSGEWVEGHQAKKVKNFFKKLDSFLKSKNILCEIEFYDETLTSIFARNNLEEMNLSNQSLLGRIDSESARILLQEYLDNRR